jgi:hypothetical protein
LTDGSEKLGSELQCRRTGQERCSGQACDEDERVQWEAGRNERKCGRKAGHGHGDRQVLDAKREERPPRGRNPENRAPIGCSDNARAAREGREEKREEREGRRRGRTSEEPEPRAARYETKQNESAWFVGAGRLRLPDPASLSLGT